MTGDEYPAHAPAIEAASGAPAPGRPAPPRRRPRPERAGGAADVPVQRGWRAHEAMPYLTPHRHDSGWAARTLRHRDDQGRWRRRTPAMAAGLSDRIWSLREWVGSPAAQVP
jgi:hypothetical protein